MTAAWSRLIRLTPAALLFVLAARTGAQPYAYVANLASDDVSVVDTATQTVVATLPAGDDPDGAAASADGTRVYVTNFLSDSLTIIDTSTNTVLATVPVGGGPVGVAVSPDGTRAYVANRAADSVSVIDTAAAAVVETIAVGRGPNAVAVTPDGTRAYVTNSFTRDPGQVSVIDLGTNRVRATVAVQHVPNRVALTPDGATAYVTNFRSWNVSAIDTATDQVLTTVRVGYKPTGIAVNPNGAYAYVTVQRAFRDFPGNLHVIDVAAQRVRESLFAGASPSSIGVLHNGGTGYVGNFQGDTLTVIDLGDEAAVGEIAVGQGPFAVAVNCVGDGCTETPYTPKPTKTVTDTPTETATPTVTLTPSRTPTRTATATLPPGIEHVEIEILPYGVDAPFEFFDIRLDTGGQTVLRFSHEVLFPPGIQVPAANEGVPDCQLFEVPPLESARFEFLPPGCVFECEGLHAELIASEPFLDLDTAAVLYFCRLEVAEWVSPGTYRLRSVNIAAGGPAGEVLAARGRDGIVIIQPPSSPSPVLSPRPTRTPVATGTATATPPPEVFLRITGASGRPGDRVSVAVALDARGRAVAGTQNELLFNAAARVAALANGRPNCTVNPAIDKSASAFSFQPSGCSGAACRAVRALVLSIENTDAIPDGALLYTCRVDIAAGVAAGTYPLLSSELGASTPDGGPIATGAVDGIITVLPRAGVRAARGLANGVTQCSGGADDGAPCAADGECPGGACVRLQGICDGAQDDGLLCDCPGGSCAAQPACAGEIGGGTCRDGANDGACCDRAFNCRGGAACVATHRLCAGGASKGMPCMSDDQCVGGACIASGRRCDGGDFADLSCIDAGDCPRAACLDPNAPPAIATTTPSPTPRRSSEDDGCAVVPPRGHGSVVLLLSLFSLLWMRRTARRQAARLSRC